MWLLHDTNDEKFIRRFLLLISAIPYSTILYLSAFDYLDYIWVAFIRLPKLARI
jgi:hypothetical protein